MAHPAVEIDVDAETGIWRTDGLPMLYLPRHFLVNNHLAVEEALGRDVYRILLQAATDKSALHWCKSTATTLNLSPMATFHHYFQRLSQRGWGQFTVETLDLQHKRGSIALRQSIFVLEQPLAGRAVCYMFEGFMTGALRYLLDDEAGIVVACTEDACAASGAACCHFSFAAEE